MADDYAYVIVFSTSHALKGEKVLAKGEIGNKLIPVPRQISSSCGVCIRIRRADVPTARGLLETAGVEISSIEIL